MSNELVKYNEPNLRYGLITRSDKEKHSHRCSYPNFFKRLILRLFKAKVGNGSVYRCECGKVYEFYKYDDQFIGDWLYSGDALWEKNGGQLEYKTSTKLLEEKNNTERAKQEELKRQAKIEREQEKWDREFKVKLLPKGSVPLNKLIDETIKKANLFK